MPIFLWDLLTRSQRAHYANGMRILRRCIGFLVAVGIISACSAQVTLAAPQLLKGVHKDVCGKSSKTTVRCFTKTISHAPGTPVTSALPAGYGPSQFHGAYGVPAISGNPGTIAVVTAYDAPTITEDLAVYNATFGLPYFPNCSATVTKACFQKVNQNGGTSYPAPNSGWALEAAMDVQTAHQMCQNCKLILVEADSANYTDIVQAVDRARLLGATVISNSYGSDEFDGETVFNKLFMYPGIAFVFSSGDTGYGVSYPAASPYVTAVGGTTLQVTAANTWHSERVWEGSGSGCSAYEAKPSFQKDNACVRRSVADIAAAGDPNTGAAVYSSYGIGGVKGWFQLGGTSLSAPLVAGMYGLANNIGSSYANAMLYKNYNYKTNLRDITYGSNGFCGTYLCQAGTSYDGPSGLGTPYDLGLFR